jgi:hypothetical protein
MSAKDLFISIAVSSPVGMSALPGLQGRVGELRAWAAKEKPGGPGMEVLPLDDFGSTPVTVKSVSNKVSEALQTVRRRVIVHFCGHGHFANAVAAWILSPGPANSFDTIDIRNFRTAIATYGVENIVIWSDACQSLTTAIGYPNTALPKGNTGYDTARFDYFLATSEGTEAYTTKVAENTYEPVFSAALADALTADPPPREAVHLLPLPSGQLQVNSQSLKSFIDNEVQLRAAGAPRLQVPSTSAGLDYPDNVFREIIIPPKTDMPGTIQWSGRLDMHKGSYAPRALSDRERVELDLVVFDARSQSETRGIFWDKARNTYHGTGEYWAAREGVLGTDAVKLVAADVYRESRAWASFVELGDGLWSILPTFFGRWCALMVSLPNGTNVAAAQSADPAHELGIRAIGWRSAYGDNAFDEAADPNMPMRLLKGILNGALSSDVLRRAISDLRPLKHFDPMLGIISGYAYDAVGDTAAIRRTASYYPRHNQPIPFDLALLCRCPLNSLPSGGFTIDLPAVEGEKPPFDGAPRFVWEARDAVEKVPVAGVIPVLRAGWSMLPFAGNAQLAELAAFAQALTSAPISTFTDTTTLDQVVKTLEIT